MKQCPKCNKMNSAYADTCKYCGYDIKWAPDDGSNYEEPPNFSAEESTFKDSETNVEKTNLEDIYGQLEELKGQISKGVKLFDVNMPFGKMVMLIIKFSFASIPAAIIMGLISSVFWFTFIKLYFEATLRSIVGH